MEREMEQGKYLRRGIMLGVCIIIADVLTKQFIVSGQILKEGEILELTSFFRVVLIWNYGISFGILNSGHSGNAHLLVLVALLVIACLAWWLWRTHSKWQANSLGLIIGGALGNVVDRLQHGAVTDFLDFFVGAYHWPAFNLADAAVCTGVLLLVAESFFAEKTE